MKTDHPDYSAVFDFKVENFSVLQLVPNFDMIISAYQSITASSQFWLECFNEMPPDGLCINYDFYKWPINLYFLFRPGLTYTF